jgi:hypothetical protein
MAVKQLQPFHCDVPLLQLTEDNMFTSFPEMPQSAQRDLLFSLMVLTVKTGHYIGPYLLWSQVSKPICSKLRLLSSSVANWTPDGRSLF